MPRSRRAIFRQALAAGLALTATTAVACQRVQGRAAVPPRSTVRIMPLGDALTEGYDVPGGYRTRLWRLLVADGFRADFVGSQRSGPESLPDRDHEGHAGWRIDQIEREAPGWISRFEPDIVLLWLGLHDLTQQHQVAAAPARLRSLIDTIVGPWPAIQVLVGTLPPAREPGLAARIIAFNAALPEMVSARRTAGALTWLVDINRVVRVSDLSDGVHPSADSHQVIAGAWYEPLRAILAGRPPASPP
jgi:acyl-CoA thioesterase I